MIRQLQSAISLFTCSCLLSMAAETSSPIGLVMTTGEVQVDGLQVPGNSAIFSGSLISSGDRSSSLRFSDGTSAVMKPGATMTVYRERSVLQLGVAMQSGVDKHPVLADGLKILGVAPNAIAQVGVRDASYIEVAAEEGESDVWTASGNLVARVKPGKTLSFAIGQAAGTPEHQVKICGELDQDYLLTDHFTSVTYQLQGHDLNPLVGKTVRVTGMTPGGTSSSSAPEVLTVSQIRKLNHSCEAAGAVPPGAVVLLIFVALGGTLLGLGVAGGFGHSAVTPTVP
jgi:hypothetical protein